MDSILVPDYARRGMPPTVLESALDSHFRIFLSDSCGLPVAYTKGYGSSRVDPVNVSGLFTAIGQCSKEVFDGKGIKEVRLDDDRRILYRQLERGTETYNLAIEPKDTWHLPGFANKLVDANLGLIAEGDERQGLQRFLDSMDTQIRKESGQLAEYMDLVISQFRQKDFVLMKPSGNRILASGDRIDMNASYADTFIRMVETLVDSGVKAFEMTFQKAAYKLEYVEEYDVYIVYPTG